MNYSEPAKLFCSGPFGLQACVFKQEGATHFGPKTTTVTQRKCRGPWAEIWR